MGSTTKNGDVQGFWTSIVPYILGGPGGGSEEGGPRDKEDNGGSSDALCRGTRKFQRLNESSWSCDEKYRVALGLAILGGGGIRVGGRRR